MTRRWKVPGDLFAGKTVAVLAPGPSLTRKAAERVKDLPRIAVRRAVHFAPDADMVVSIDGPSGTLDDAFWADIRGFQGLKVTGTESELIDALYVAIPHERVRLSEHHAVEFRNNGLAAMRIAAQAGAKKLVLVGFDTERYEAVHAAAGFVGLTAGLAQLIAELGAQGIAVERVTQ